MQGATQNYIFRKTLRSICGTAGAQTYGPQRVAFAASAVQSVKWGPFYGQCDLFLHVELVVREFGNLSNNSITICLTERRIVQAVNNHECLRRQCEAVGLDLREYTVKKSYLFLQGRCKFPAPSLQKFVGESGKFFPFPKAPFLHVCFQREKPFHSGEWAFFHVQKCNSPAISFNSKINGKIQAWEWEKDFTMHAPPLPPACPGLSRASVAILVC